MIDLLAPQFTSTAAVYLGSANIHLAIRLAWSPSLLIAATFGWLAYASSVAQEARETGI